MHWLLATLLVVAGLQTWLLVEIRRALGVRGRPALTRSPVPTTVRANYAGALPPNRFAVVRWPEGSHAYQGCLGAQARQIYEHQHPKPGEEIEFWELGARRGHKVG